MNHETSTERDLLAALRHYVTDSGRLLVIELDEQGRISDSNVTFRSRFAGVKGIQGQPIARFFATNDGDSLTIEPGLPRRAPVPYVAKDIHSGETYLLHAYAVGRGTLLIGELADAKENDIIERMGHFAIELSRLHDELALANQRNEALARTDPLTGIVNRRYFMERLSISIEHAQARRHRLSLLMIDLDHFKHINDQCGHAGGDSVLIAVAALLLAQVRAADLPGRFGGEEFVIYMLDADLQAATEAAERLRVQIGALRPIDPDRALTASFGVTELTPDDSADSLLKRADHLLYRAKTEGRNRVVAGLAARRPPPR